MNTKIKHTCLKTVMLALISICAHAQAKQNRATDIQRAFETTTNFLTQQGPASVTLLFRNISAPGTARGSVIASPSRSNPDYYYHWVRDAGLVMNSVVTLYLASSGDSKAMVKQTLIDYLRFSRINQTTPNPSQAMHRSGLGEPKFNVDGSVVPNWPRPQNDGPALRSIALIRFADALMSEGGQENLLREIYEANLPAHSVVKADLEFISEAWAQGGFDLWEECYGYHFYTRLVQYKALMDGADFARRMGDPNAADSYERSARYLRVALDDHWNGSFLRENFGQNCENKYTHLDSATILGVLHTLGENALYLPSNERVLATAFEIEKAFRSEFAINNVTFDHDGNTVSSGIGRYPNDSYNGYQTGVQGNPWVLATNAFGEFYYRLVVEYQHRGLISVTPVNQKFFRALLPGENFSGNIGHKDPLFQKILLALIGKGDSFVLRNRLHGLGNGSFSEQFNRNNGHMQGAEDLTWNYASFLSLIFGRAEIKVQ